MFGDRSGSPELVATQRCSQEQKKQSRYLHIRPPHRCYYHAVLNGKVVCYNFNDLRIRSSFLTGLDFAGFFIRSSPYEKVTPMLLTCCSQWNTVVCYDLNDLRIQGRLVGELNFAGCFIGS